MLGLGRVGFLGGSEWSWLLGLVSGNSELGNEHER